MKFPSLIDFEGLETDIMDEKQSEMMIQCVMLEIQHEGDRIPKPEELESHILFQIIKKRLDFYKVEYNEWALLFLSSLADRPAISVMLAYTAADIANKYGKFNMESLSQAFPMGFPTTRCFQRYWTSQKGSDGENILDLNETWRA